MDYTDINIRQYIWLMDYLDGNGEDPLSIQLSILAYLTGKNESELEEMPLDKYNALAESIEFLTVAPVAREIKGNKIMIKGRKFRLLKNWKDMTAGQYIDYTSLQEGGYKNLANTIAVFLIPDEAEGYLKGYNVAEVIEFLRENCDVQTAVDIAFFLRGKFSKSIQRTLLYLEATLTTRRLLTKGKEKKKEIKKLERQLRLLRDGIPS